MKTIAQIGCVASFVLAACLGFVIPVLGNTGPDGPPPPHCEFTNVCSGGSFSIANLSLSPSTNLCVGESAIVTLNPNVTNGSVATTYENCVSETNDVVPIVVTNVWVFTQGTNTTTYVDAPPSGNSWSFTPVQCGAGGVSVTSYWLDGCNPSNVYSAFMSTNFMAWRVDIAETQVVACTNQTPVFTLTNTCGGVSWEVSPSVAGGAQVIAGVIVSGTNCCSYTVTARSTDNPNCTDTTTLVVTKEEILKPEGSYAATVNPVSSWQSSHPYHFDFQGVRSNTPGVYSLSITGLVCPDSLVGYSWSLSPSAGTLSGTNTATPTHYPPTTAGRGTLKLDASYNGTNIGCAVTKDLWIYRDHLARDIANFGTGISCAGPTWLFTAFGATVTMSNRWNCHGSTLHQYNGSGSGNEFADTLAFIETSWLLATNVQVTHATNGSGSHPSLGTLNRGDVIIYYANSPTAGIMHSQTCLGGGTDTYGANNEPLTFPGKPGLPPNGNESFKWAVSTAGDWANKVWVPEYGTNVMPVRIKVYRKP